MQDEKLEFRKTNMEILEARQNFKLSLRKKKIEDVITQRREKYMMKYDRKEYEINVEKLNIPEEIKNNQINSLEELYKFIKELLMNYSNGNTDLLKFGIFLLRKNLSTHKHVPIYLIISENIIQILLEIIDVNLQDESILYEIFWCFTNISYISEIKTVTDLGEERFIQIYKNILDSYEDRNQILIEQLFWHLGNLCSHNAPIRESLIKSGIYDRIVQFMNKSRIFEGTVINGIWFFAVCAFTKPEMDEENLNKCLQIILNYIRTNDDQVITDCITALSNISETEYSNILKMIIESNICEYIITNEKFNSKRNRISSIRVIGNLLSNENYIVDYLLDKNCIKFLSNFLFDPLMQIKKETLWALSNISAGSIKHKMNFIDSEIIPMILDKFCDSDYEIVKESVFVISNLLHSSNFEICFKLVEMKLINYFIYVLKNHKMSEIIIIVLNSLLSLFSLGNNLDYMDQSNPFAKLFEDCGGIEALQKIEFKFNNQILEMVTLIYDNFFDIDSIKN